MNLIIVCDSCDTSETVYINPDAVEHFDLDAHLIHRECNDCIAENY